MSHEHESPTPVASELAPDESTVAPNPEIDAMLTRARRILGGDIRPDDYLAVTPEVRAAAEFEMNYVRTHMKLEPLPEDVKHQLRGWLLSFHYGEQNILYIENERGVIVLAAGLDQIGALVRGIPDELQEGIISDCPEPF